MVVQDQIAENMTDAEIDRITASRYDKGANLITFRSLSGAKALKPSLKQVVNHLKNRMIINANCFCGKGIHPGRQIQGLRAR